MADRGMGIRLFNSKNMLQNIFDDFEEAEDDASDSDNVGTSVVISQLRHFVVQVEFSNHVLMVRLTFETQEYIAKPLLLDPSDVKINGLRKTRTPDKGYKVKTYSHHYLIANLTTTTVVSSSSILRLFGCLTSVSLYSYPGLILSSSVCRAWG